MTAPLPTDADVALFGNRFITQEVPSREFPDGGMTAADAMRLVAEDLAIEGDPARNLATFVTTWMEPEAQRIIARTCTATSSTMRSIRVRPRSSSGASGCSRTCSTRPVRPRGRGPRDRRRRSCWVRCR